MYFVFQFLLIDASHSLWYLGESVDVAPGENIDVNVKIYWCDDE